MSIKRKFYSSFNSILSICKQAPELVQLHLIKSYCLPYLSYCIDALELPDRTVHQLSVCQNDALEKVSHSRGGNQLKNYNISVVNCHSTTCISWHHGTFVQDCCPKITSTLLYCSVLWTFTKMRIFAQNMELVQCRNVEDLRRCLSSSLLALINADMSFLCSFWLTEFFVFYTFLHFSHTILHFLRIKILYTGWAKKMKQLWFVVLLQPFKIK